jgi:hypothetical protein
MVDYLETTGPFIASAVQAFAPPFLLHNSLWDWSLMHPQALNEPNALEITRQTLALTQAPWLSVHLGFSTATVGFDQTMQPRSAWLSRNEVMETICRNVVQLAQSISVPLILENLDYNPSGAYEYICEPTFIAEVLNKTDVGLLLDLAHARVSAARLGLTIADYLAQLPLARVKQLHVSGPRWEGSVLRDAHETLLDEDYALLRDVLERTAPAAITLEYAREGPAVITQLEQLRTLLRHY